MFALGAYPRLAVGARWSTYWLPPQWTPQLLLRRPSRLPMSGSVSWPAIRRSSIHSGCSPDFATALGDFGLQATPSAIGFIAQLTDVTRSYARHHPDSGPFAELASLAL